MGIKYSPAPEVTRAERILKMKIKYIKYDLNRLYLKTRYNTGQFLHGLKYSDNRLIRLFFEIRYLPYTLKHYMKINHYAYFGAPGIRQIIIFDSLRKRNKAVKENAHLSEITHRQLLLLAKDEALEIRSYSDELGKIMMMHDS